MAAKNETIEEKPEVKTRQFEWMLKPCDMYYSEYKDCKCLRARFNQYFIHGEVSDCTQWKEDYENCNRWKTSDDDESYNALLLSEQKRRIQRLSPHFNNDVWTKRDKPPENWNKPLPEWMLQRHRGTLLEYKQRDLETGEVNDLDVKLPLCIIL